MPATSVRCLPSNGRRRDLRSQSRLAQRMMISTRRFCGSRTPAPVGTSKCVSPNPWMPIAALRHAITNELARHCLGASYRQPLIVRRRTGRIRISVHLDARVLNVRRVVRGLVDDLARPISQCGLVPIEEHQIGAGRCRRRCGNRCRRGWRWCLPEIIPQPNEEGMVEIIPELD